MAHEPSETRKAAIPEIQKSEEGAQSQQLQQSVNQSPDLDEAYRAQCRGLPILVEWDGESRRLIDGFGMCSPNRWNPDLRGGNLSSEAVVLLEGFHSDLRSFVLSKFGGGHRKAAFWQVSFFSVQWPRTGGLEEKDGTEVAFA